MYRENIFQLLAYYIPCKIDFSYDMPYYMHSMVDSISLEANECSISLCRLQYMIFYIFFSTRHRYIVVFHIRNTYIFSLCYFSCLMWFCQLYFVKYYTFAYLQMFVVHLYLCIEFTLMYFFITAYYEVVLLFNTRLFRRHKVVIRSGQCTFLT